MRPRNLQIACLLSRLTIILLQCQRTLLFELYHFHVMEEEFKIRRRNRQMLLLMIMTHMNQQNAQRRRRAWVWPRPENWLRYLIASPGLNFI